MAETDYKALCKELFGTTEETKIRELAAKWKKKQTRNAGRKRALSVDDMDIIDTMRTEGATISAIARHFGVSRPVISQYLNARPSKDYTMRIDFRLGKKTCTVIYVDLNKRRLQLSIDPTICSTGPLGSMNLRHGKILSIFWKIGVSPKAANMPSRS